MKHLIIRNVGPVRQADLSLKRVNMIIGPQSSGKSTVLKVAAFCSWMERQIQLTLLTTHPCKLPKISTTF